jgi:HD-GYP domain-containing protein (c-di-GMP phosphodiesterase class II)
MCLSDEHSLMVKTAGYLHDFGKLAVPPKIFIETLLKFT